MSVKQFRQIPQATHIPAPDVLIIEHESQVAGEIESLLKHEGYSTRTIRDGQAATQYINYRNPAKLVVLDVELPYSDGLNIIKRIRANKKWQHAAVVMLSKKATQKDIAACYALGASDFLLKPFMPKTLVSRINRVIKLAA